METTHNSDTGFTEAALRSFVIGFYLHSKGRPDQMLPFCKKPAPKSSFSTSCEKRLCKVPTHCRLSPGPACSIPTACAREMRSLNTVWCRSAAPLVEVVDAILLLLFFFFFAFCKHMNYLSPFCEHKLCLHCVICRAVSVIY